MKIFLLFLATLLPVIGIFATSESCTIIENDPRTPDQLLTTCAHGTVGIDPNRTTNDKEWVRERIIMIAEWAISLGALLAVAAIVWSGIQYTKAYGDDEHLKKSKTTAIYALIGLLLLMGSFGLVDIFINFIYRVAGT